MVYRLHHGCCDHEILKQISETILQENFGQVYFGPKMPGFHTENEVVCGQFLTGVQAPQYVL